MFLTIRNRIIAIKNQMVRAFTAVAPIPIRTRQHALMQAMYYVMCLALTSRAQAAARQRAHKAAVAVLPAVPVLVQVQEAAAMRL